MRDAMELRMRGLERTNRILLVLLLGVAVLVWVRAGASQSSEPNVVRAQEFELVDANGNVRATLGSDEDGATGLFVRDASGGMRISLTQDPEQSALFIHDDKGTVRIGVAQFSHGGGGLALHGADSKGATVLYHKGSGSLAFYDEAGNATARIPPAKP